MVGDRGRAACACARACVCVCSIVKDMQPLTLWEVSSMGFQTLRIHD